MMNKELKFSFEFFPSKNARDESVAWESLKKLESFDPQFYSVTFGAGGGERIKTDSFVKKINKESNVPVAGHLTCVDMSKDEINDIALNWFEKGIKRIVALRGDVRNSGEQYKPHPDGYKNATDMTAGLKKLANFDISVAGYPEIHPDSKSKKDDLDNLKRKVDAGANRIITQFFFDEKIFLNFRDDVTKAGIKVELLPGIMPIQNYKRVKNFSDKCGTNVPDWIRKEFEGSDENPEIQKMIGSSIATDLVKKLQKEGVNEFHFYTLNKYELSYAVCSRLKSYKKFLQTKNNKDKGEIRI
ncbi:MAG: methylenetetrahydrofolate reductase [NAD(P)H] [Pelagibacteraceae bacterium]